MANLTITNKSLAETILRETLLKATEMVLPMWNEDSSTIYLAARNCDGSPEFVFDGCRFVEIEGIDCSAPCRIIEMSVRSFGGTTSVVHDLRNL